MMDNPQLKEMLEKIQHLPSSLKEGLLTKMLDEVQRSLFDIFNSCNVDFSSEIGVNKEVLKEMYKNEIARYSQISQLYVKGNIADAIDEMGKVIQSNSAILETSFSKADGLLFRVRSSSEYQLYEREAMFHIPLDKTALIGNQRYSINGFPCLYLGASIYDCWEETRRPDLEKLNVVAYQYTKAKPMRFLLIDYPKTIKEIGNYQNVVLFLLCSYFSKNDEDKHKTEYVIPELVFHALIRMRETAGWAYDGIAYISSRFFKPSCFYPCNHDLMMNYVIPIKGEQTVEVDDSKNRYCAVLADMFKLSETKALFTERIRGRDFPKFHPRPTGYVNSLFYQMEQQFKGCKFEKI